VKSCHWGTKYLAIVFSGINVGSQSQYLTVNTIR